MGISTTRLPLVAALVVGSITLFAGCFARSGQPSPFSVLGSPRDDQKSELPPGLVAGGSITGNGQAYDGGLKTDLYYEVDARYSCQNETTGLSQKGFRRIIERVVASQYYLRADQCRADLPAVLEVPRLEVSQAIRGLVFAEGRLYLHSTVVPTTGAQLLDLSRLSTPLIWCTSSDSGEGSGHPIELLIHTLGESEIPLRASLYRFESFLPPGNSVGVYQLFEGQVVRGSGSPISFESKNFRLVIDIRGSPARTGESAFPASATLGLPGFPSELPMQCRLPTPERE